LTDAIPFPDHGTMRKQHVNGMSFYQNGMLGRRLAGLAVMGLVLWTLSMGVLAEPMPPLEEIMDKAIARASSNAVARASSTKPLFRYPSRTTIENYDDEHFQRDRQERLYEVDYPSTYRYLVKMIKNGEEITGSDLQKERESEDQKQGYGSKSKDRPRDPRKTLLTQELVSRYEFTLTSQQVVNGRTSYLLYFSPNEQKRPNKPKSDHLLDELTGKIWIDTEDFEISKLEVFLRKKAKSWQGLFGSLDHMRFTLERVRTPQGAWADYRLNGTFTGRALFKSFDLSVVTKSDPMHPFQSDRISPPYSGVK
jgi:hypothetical protein